MRSMRHMSDHLHGWVCLWICKEKGFSSVGLFPILRQHCQNWQRMLSQQSKGPQRSPTPLTEEETGAQRCQETFSRSRNRPSHSLPCVLIPYPLICSAGHQRFTWHPVTYVLCLPTPFIPLPFLNIFIVTVQIEGIGTDNFEEEPWRNNAKICVGSSVWDVVLQDPILYSSLYLLTLSCNFAVPSHDVWAVLSHPIPDFRIGHVATLANTMSQMLH